jgi:hypothetical protein
MWGLELGYFAHYDVGHNASNAFVRDFWGDIAIRKCESIINYIGCIVPLLVDANSNLRKKNIQFLFLNTE